MQITQLPLLFPLLLLISLSTHIGILQAATYYREELQDRSEDIWSLDDSSDDGGSSERRPPSSNRRYFKSFSQLDSPSEQWPEDFYRTVSICQNGTIPWKVYTMESDGNCTHGKIAVGRYKNAQNETGWGILEVQTFAGYEPEMQAYAAGLVEGVLSKVQIYYHYKNTVAGLCKNATQYCQKLYRYLNENLEWIRSQAHSREPTDLYWRHVNLTFTQLTGINDGYGKERDDGYWLRTNFYITPVFMLQLSGELFDLDHLFKKKKLRDSDPEPGKCSGFVKVTEGNKDLLMSHVAMSGYNTMNRVVKLYKFAYDQKEVPGYAVSFSGYAGVLASADDYTLTSAGLLSIETTISVFNETCYQAYVKAEGQLHCWIRTIISNQLASTAHDWVKLFARYNSGTYNNQWTITAYNLFKPGQELPEADLVWILEQIPGTTVSRDVTWFIRKFGYWPSYNIPYLSKISELSGFEQKGNINNWWRWGFSPRAHIFHRDQAKVKDIDTLRALMRYNDYKHDEFSRCKCNPPYSAEASVSTRGDLNPVNGTWEVSGMGHRNHGSLDYKGTNYELFKQMRFELVGGPTYGGHSDLPFFSWQTTNIEAPHWGQPTNWNFKPFVTLWSTPVQANVDAGNDGNGMEDSEEDAADEGGNGVEEK